MRLSSITEVRFSKAYGKVQPLLSVMPAGKRKHSRRAAKELHKAGVGSKGIYSALLHDYLERGGDIETLASHIYDLGLPPDIISIVGSLSSDEKQEPTEGNEPLEHMRQVIGSIDDADLRNIMILVKMSDRIDNLRKRARKRGKIGKKYGKKSQELVNFLLSNYSGKRKHMRKLLNAYNNIVGSKLAEPASI